MAPQEKKEGRSVDRSAPQGHRPQGGEGTPRRGHRPLLFYTHNINTRPAIVGNHTLWEKVWRVAERNSGGG